MKLLTILLAIALVGCSSSSEDTRTPEELRIAIEAATKSEDYPAAEKALTSLLAHQPNDFNTVVARAGIRVFLGDATGVKEDFAAAIKIDPEKGEQVKFYIADRSVWRAREFDMAKRYPEAMKIYDVLVALYPESGMTYHDRGGMKTSMGDFEGAIADLTKAIEFDEGNNSAGDSYALRARAKRANGDVAGADADDAKAQAVFDSR